MIGIMDVFAIIYLILNLILIVVGSVAYPFFIFNKACKLGLNPPAPFNLFRTQSVAFWIFIDEKSKIEEYQELRKYVIIPKWIGVVNFVTGAVLLVYYWADVQRLIYHYFKERWLFH